MTEFKNIIAILTELDTLAAKADQFTAQKQANAANDDGRAAAINLSGVKRYSEYITDIDAYIKKANAARDLIEQKQRELKQAQHDAAIYSDIFDPWNI